jgi:hypothetical protein
VVVTGWLSTSVNVVESGTALGYRLWTDRRLTHRRADTSASTSEPSRQAPSNERSCCNRPVQYCDTVINDVEPCGSIRSGNVFAGASSPELARIATTRASTSPRRSARRASSPELARMAETVMISRSGGAAEARRPVRPPQGLSAASRGPAQRVCSVDEGPPLTRLIGLASGHTGWREASPFDGSAVCWVHARVDQGVARRWFRYPLESRVRAVRGRA